MLFYILVNIFNAQVYSASTNLDMQLTPKLIEAFILFMIIRTTYEAAFRTRLAMVESVENCRQYINAPMTINDVELTRPSKGQININGKIIITDVINGPITLSLKTHKCDTVSPDKCEHFQEFRFSQFCDQLLMKNIIWSPFVSKMEPKLVCPLQPGVYNIRNGSFDMGMFTSLPVEGYQWLVIARMIHDNSKGNRETFFCLETRAYIAMERNKKPRYLEQVTGFM